MLALAFKICIAGLFVIAAIVGLFALWIFGGSKGWWSIK